MSSFLAKIQLAQTLTYNIDGLLTVAMVSSSLMFHGNLDLAASV